MSEEKTMICLEETVEKIRKHQKQCGYAWDSNYQKGLADALRIVLREGEIECRTEETAKSTKHT